MGDPQPRVAAWIAAAPGADLDRRAETLPLARAAAVRGPAVLLATCHRVELYAGDASLIDGADMETAGMVRLDGVAAVRHVVDVAIGLESAVLGEDQLLHQLRGAVTQARRTARLGRDLERTLDQALRAGRIARSWRPVGSDAPGRTLADAVASILARRLGSVDGRRILVVGAGEMGEAALVVLRGAGARPAIASPSHDHVADVAARHGVDAWPIDPGARLEDVAAVIVALAGPWSVTTGSLQALRQQVLVIDLSMPPALPAEVADALGDRYLGIDDVARAHGPDSTVVARYRTRLRGLAVRTTSEILTELGEPGPTGAAMLADRVERQRRQAVEAFLRERPGLDPTARDEIEAASRLLAARLFRVPLERLADDPRGARRQAAEELFGR
jgi:glutamyl-tRNA reductase